MTVLMIFQLLVIDQFHMASGCKGNISQKVVLNVLIKRNQMGSISKLRHPIIANSVNASYVRTALRNIIVIADSNNHFSDILASFVILIVFFMFILIGLI